MIKQDLAKNIINYLAKNRKGMRDVIDIFGYVMKPIPQHPKRWAEMVEILDEMQLDGLVQIHTQLLESRRVATFYQLTAKGWTTARRGGQADESQG